MIPEEKFWKDEKDKYVNGTTLSNGTKISGLMYYIFMIAQTKLKNEKQQQSK